MCQSCYWCISSLINNEHIASCPLCGTENIELLPISKFENYRFNNDYKRGMVLEFWTEIQDESRLDYGRNQVFYQIVAKARRCKEKKRKLICNIG